MAERTDGSTGPQGTDRTARAADGKGGDGKGGDGKQASFLSELFAPVGGFGVTFATMFRKLETEEYPEVRRPTAPRFHGRHQLNRHPDGLEKCVGCELCAWACPADAIYVEGADNTADERFSPGERYGRVYQINYLRCIFCGLCIEACPTRALTMTNFYEMADDDRGKLIYEKQQLLAPLQAGMVAPPHPMVEGLEERDYYQGKVAKSTPAQQEWVFDRDDAIERRRRDGGSGAIDDLPGVTNPEAEGRVTDAAPITTAETGAHS